MAKKWWWAVWPFDTGKKLPEGENVSTLLFIGMIFFVGVGIAIFFISMMSGAAAPFKVVGVTTEVYQGDIIRVDIVGGTDVSGLINLQVFLNGTETTPHWQNPNYTAGAVLYFRAPTGTPAGFYPTDVIGTFRDGNIQTLWTSVLTLYGDALIERDVEMDVDIYIDDIMKVEILGGEDLENLQSISMYVDNMEAAYHRQNPAPEKGAELFFKTGTPLAGSQHEVVIEGKFADGTTSVLKMVQVPLAGT